MCAGALINDRPPHLTCVDKGLQTDEGSETMDSSVYGSAESGGRPCAIQRGHLALECVRRSLGTLPHSVLRGRGTVDPCQCQATALWWPASQFLLLVILSGLSVLRRLNGCFDWRNEKVSSFVSSGVTAIDED